VFGQSFTVARIAGIAIEINPSWLIIVAIISFSFSNNVFPDQYEGWSTATYWSIGIATAALFFGSVLLHELAHALVAKRRGVDVPKITLFIFGGVSHMADQPRSAREEFYIAAAGPASSILIALACAGIFAAAHDRQEQIEAMFVWLAAINGMLAFFNLLPGFPLDGGRVFRSIVWGRTRSFRKATTVASNVGIVFGYVLIVGGIALALGGLVLNGIWFAFIGWFLSSAARNESQSLQLESVLSPLSARDIMDRNFASVTPGTSIQEVVDRHMVLDGHRAVMVANDDRVLGILTVSDVRRLEPSERSNTAVQAAMTPRDTVITVPAATPALEVLMLISEKRLNQVPVLEEGRMIGLISRREILDRVQMANKLGFFPGSGADRRAG
jgi:Zn-dependent protease